MSRLIESNESRRKKLASAHLEDLIDTLYEIHDILWPREAPWKVVWDAEHCQKIAAKLRKLEDDG